ncbi:MAG: TolB protein, partial [Actinomycetota bacterium]|nr:TolB protein [Actinomycetota bacterium]
SAVLVWRAFDPIGRGKTGGASPPVAVGALSTYRNQVGLALALDYPSNWFARSIVHSADSVGPDELGVIVANTSSGMPSATGSPSPGPLPENPNLPADFVRLTILTKGDGHPDPGVVDSPMPLSMSHAKHAPGPVNIRSISATVSGVRYEISIQGGPQATPADLDAADQIVRSIRPTDASPSAASPPPSGLTGSLVFAVGPEGSSELFGYDSAIGTATDLGPGRDPAVSPDGTQIAFRSGNADRPGGQLTQIGIMQIDGSKAHSINIPVSVGGEPLGAGAPAWSPDGSSVAFSAGIGIYVYDGQDVTQLTQYPGAQSCYDLEPSWTLDGSSIVFAVRCDGGNLGIWSVDINGANRHQIAAPSPGGVIDYRYPSWSPDGASLLFEGVAKDHGYSYDSYVMDNSGGVTRVTHSSCERPTWVSDGNWIACPTVGGIGLARATGSDTTALTLFPRQSVSSVAWTPHS